MEYALPISISSYFYFGKLVTSFAPYQGGIQVGIQVGILVGIQVGWIGTANQKNMIHGKTKGNMWVPKT